MFLLKLRIQKALPQFFWRKAFIEKKNYQFLMICSHEKKPLMPQSAAHSDELLHQNGYKIWNSIFEGQSDNEWRIL